MKFRRIRIQMPKWQAIQNANWAKELLMTFVGATLSIVLTFGTANFLEKKQQREDGRQLAMMVIHDMEKMVEVFHQYAKDDEKFFNNAQYILENMQSFDSIPTDSLIIIMQYITSSALEDYSCDESSERTFFSSHEAWKNIDNAAFIDQVQSFYHYRRKMYAMLKDEYLFEKPVSNEEFHKCLIESNDKNWRQSQFYHYYIKQFLKRGEVKLYVNNSFFRRSNFNGIEQWCRTVANRCKFMMGISDEDLEQYVRERERTGQQLTEKQLVGKWKTQTSDEDLVENVFNSDHTGTATQVRYIAYSVFTGRLIVRLTLNNKWELKGDSLITYTQPGDTFEIDRSQIHFAADKAQEVDNLVKHLEQSYNEWLDHFKNEDELRSAEFVSIDKSGNKIELREENTATYLIRCQTP